MIDSNIPKRRTVLAAAGLAVALLLGFALNPTPAFAASKGPCKKDPMPAGCETPPDDGGQVSCEQVLDRFQPAGGCRGCRHQPHRWLGHPLGLRPGPHYGG